VSYFLLVHESLAKTFAAAIDLLTTPENGGYALLNREPHHYEYGKAIIFIY